MIRFLLLVALLVSACSDSSSGDGPADSGSDRRRNIPDGNDGNGGTPDTSGNDAGSDGPCIPDCAGRVCGLDPVCGAQCGVPCNNGFVCSDGTCVVDDGTVCTPACGEGFLCTGGSCIPDDGSDPLAALSTECAGFCTALCDFLLDCGKDDPTCLQRCGASARFRALSTGACTEGSQVIALEQCALWLDCGGQECAIDAMCLEVLPGISYQCAPICDHTQTQPACTGTQSCGTVADATGSTMGALGMCWSLF